MKLTNTNKSALGLFNSVIATLAPQGSKYHRQPKATTYAVPTTTKEVRIFFSDLIVELGISNDSLSRADVERIAKTTADRLNCTIDEADLMLENRGANTRPKQPRLIPTPLMTVYSVGVIIKSNGI